MIWKCLKKCGGGWVVCLYSLWVRVEPSQLWLGFVLSMPWLSSAQHIRRVVRKCYICRSSVVYFSNFHKTFVTKIRWISDLFNQCSKFGSALRGLVRMQTFFQILGLFSLQKVHFFGHKQHYRNIFCIHGLICRYLFHI